MNLLKDRFVYATNKPATYKSLYAYYPTQRKKSEKKRLVQNMDILFQQGGRVC
jgi:hypothetical protein